MEPASHNRQHKPLIHRRADNGQPPGVALEKTISASPEYFPNAQPSQAERD